MIWLPVGWTARYDLGDGERQTAVWVAVGAAAKNETEPLTTRVLVQQDLYAFAHRFWRYKNMQDYVSCSLLFINSCKSK